jgi:transcription elongation factor GreA
MIEEKEYLTKEKFEALSEELEHLKKVKRKEVAENLEFAKALGDLSENAEYHDAREEQAAIEERISKIETVLASAQIMKQHHSNIVEVGSSVVVQKSNSKEHSEFEVVGSEEANAAERKISFKSPLGQAMLGKKKGDTFVVKAPKGDVTYKVVDIK